MQVLVVLMYLAWVVIIMAKAQRGPEDGPKPIHLETNTSRVACGKRASRVDRTSIDVTRVTCEACERTVRYREAVRRASD